MATIFAANESQVKVAGKPVEGVRSLEYRRVQARENVFGLGTNERIGMVSGGQVIEAQLPGRVDGAGHRRAGCGGLGAGHRRAGPCRPADDGDVR